jgi:triosephosphate isomerase
MPAQRRRPLIMGNWKMNLGPSAAENLTDRLLAILPPDPKVDVAVAPTFIALGAVCRRLDRSGTIIPGAQNMHWEDQGALTGEIAPPMLAEAGARMVILGHSERRALFGETDDMIGRKVAAAYQHRLIPVLCVGEQESERDAGSTLDVVGRQVRAGLEAGGPPTAGGLVLAYEPVWAIGTGRTPTTAQIQEVHRFIREELAGIAGEDTAQETRILYGGSMNPGNSADILALPDVDGGLVGGAALDPAGFLAIIESASD